MSLMLSLFLSTFILEDVALGSALALISNGQLSFAEAFLVCSLGIGVGDLGLYFFGRFAAQIPFFKKKTESAQFIEFLETFTKNNKMDFAVVISRAIPGTRVPTYLAAGVIRYSLLKFTVLTIFSVAAWVFIALYFCQAFFNVFQGQWVLAFILFFVALSLFKTVIFLLNDVWSRRALAHSLRKWLHFEFWPAWFFYLPIVPYYIFLSIRYRSFLIPFYASPHFKHGGLIGESKWDFLKHLDVEARTTLPAFVLDRNMIPANIHEKLMSQRIQFPFILKPDVGQRGFGVRVVRSEQEMFDYLNLSSGDVIAQQKSQYLSEAGIFYVRQPLSDRGFVFSITDKKFPSVTGDGKTSLGHLILGDKRARIIASTYFARHIDVLDQILPSNEKFVLSECGNHCQGALFLNGQHLSTPELLTEIEKITLKIPEFYFGRIDIRYNNESDLKKGINFEIIEVNGAGSEATHIWDSKTELLEAYKVLYRQWGLLFSIGSVVKKQGLCQKPNLKAFIMDCAKVFFRKGPLTTSS